jgi:hypothetical protein
MMLIYGVPEYTPGILPFAFNGGGTFYAFDLRGRRERRECPIVGAQCCVPKGAYSVATSFLRACQGRTFID